MYGCTSYRPAAARTGTTARGPTATWRPWAAGSAAPTPHPVAIWPPMCRLSPGRTCPDAAAADLGPPAGHRPGRGGAGRRSAVHAADLAGAGPAGVTDGARPSAGAPARTVAGSLSALGRGRVGGAGRAVGRLRVRPLYPQP